MINPRGCRCTWALPYSLSAFSMSSCIAPFGILTVVWLLIRRQRHRLKRHCYWFMMIRLLLSWEGADGCCLNAQLFIFLSRPEGPCRNRIRYCGKVGPIALSGCMRMKLINNEIQMVMWSVLHRCDVLVLRYCLTVCDILIGNIW